MTRKHVAAHATPQPVPPPPCAPAPDARAAPDPLLARILQVAPPVLARVYTPDSCIAATRLLCTLLPRLGYTVAPCPVTVTIYNAAFVDRHQRAGRLPATAAETRQWADEAGAWWLGLGYPTGRNNPARWEGHLVALIRTPDQTSLLDLTLSQATRPAYQIRLGPQFLPVPPTFAQGRIPVFAAYNGCLVHYQANPTNQDYRSAPDWCRSPPGLIAHLQRQILTAL